MKTMWLFFFTITLLFTDLEAQAMSYEAFQKDAESQYAENQTTGRSYLIAGSLGLVTSFGLGIRSSETLPKIGYSLMQVLSSGLVIHGARLWFVGDEKTRLASRLRREARSLARIQSLSRENRTLLLDDRTTRELYMLEDDANEMRQVQGGVELALATAAFSQIAFSKLQDPSTKVLLGFVGLATTIAGISDLFLIDFEPKKAVTFAPKVGVDHIGVALNF